ncbi:MAG TPA: hypothetical protein VFS20_28300 [Longimicrobium sp.]|nr:hypothetical protein [Longimicrobium sp.]
MAIRRSQPRRPCRPSEHPELGKLANGAVVQIHEAKGIWRRVDPVQQRWVSSKFLVPG